jgi:K+-sensing histidine kinase KdpD
VQPLQAIPQELQERFEAPGPAVALPILDASQGPLGLLVIARPAEAEPFSTEDLQLLDAFANQAAIAISKSRLLQREQDEGYVNDVLREMSEALSGKLDLDTVANVALDYLRKGHPGT